MLNVEVYDILQMKTWIKLFTNGYLWGEVSGDAVINTLILKEKLSIFAKAFVITDFVPSDGWIMRWKRRFNISFKKISGERASCTPEMVSPWKETSLLTLLSSYDLKNIYNADEFGLNASNALVVNKVTSE